jgi:hypothetical protein
LRSAKELNHVTPNPVPEPLPVPVPPAVVPWRGVLAFALLALVGAFGPDITPSGYWPDLDHYIPRYIFLAFSVGFGLSAVRSPQRIDRLFGIAVLLVGGVLVVYIAMECLRIVGW